MVQMWCKIYHTQATPYPSHTRPLLTTKRSWEISRFGGAWDGAEIVPKGISKRGEHSTGMHRMNVCGIDIEFVPSSRSPQVLPLL